MPYADLHIHPTLKTQFSDAPDKFKADEKVIPDVVLNSLVNLCSDMGEVIESQANFRQLVENNVKLACFALYSPEPEIIGSPLLAQAVNNNLNARRYISKTRLEAFRNGTIKPFEFTRDFELQTALDLNFPDLGKVIPLKKNTVINEGTSKNVYVVFSIEGCHSLLNSFNDFNNAAGLANIITTNLQKLLDDGIPIFSVNLTHLVNYPLCNHAFGMQFLYDEKFFPTGNGLTDAAKQVALFCYDNNIHVDIKHLSIKSRMDLYRLKTDNGHMDTPIVCTHAGFTGISWDDYPNYILSTKDETADYYEFEVCKPRGWLDQTSFNANTINLFDEDIANILRTRGLIGISLDKRITGFTDPRNSSQDDPDQLVEIDYFSIKEYTDPLMYGDRDDSGGMVDNDHCLFRNEIDDISPTGSRMIDLHFKHLVNHLVHIYKVAKAQLSFINSIDWLPPIDPLEAVKKHVCIGSDFDGLINPVYCTVSVEDFDDLEARFKSDLKGYFKEGTKVELSTNDVKTIIDNFFYNNAKRFITNWVSTQP